MLVACGRKARSNEGEELKWAGLLSIMRFRQAERDTSGVDSGRQTRATPAGPVDHDEACRLDELGENIKFRWSNRREIIRLLLQVEDRSRGYALLHHK